MGLKLVGEVALDGSGFESGLKRIEGAVHHTGDAIKNLALSAIGIFGIEEAISKTIETADKLIDTSRRLGVGLEALQELGFAARQNGADIDQLTSFIEKLNSTRIDPKHWPSFEKLGIGSPASGDIVDLIMKLSDNLRNRSSQEVIGPLRDIGGKGAGEMLVMLKDNLAEVREEARKLGVVISTQDVVALKVIADEFKVLSQIIMADLAPAISWIEKQILHFVNGLRAAGTFVGQVEGQAGFKRILSAFMHPFTVDEGLKKIIAESFTAAQSQLTAANLATDQQLANAVSKQREIERVNSLPDMAGSVSIKGEKQYTDPLLRIGNFLGGSSNPIVSIAQLHLSVAREQLEVQKRIANNTSGSTDQMPPF